MWKIYSPCLLLLIIPCQHVTIYDFPTFLFLGILGWEWSQNKSFGDKAKKWLFGLIIFALIFKYFNYYCYKEMPLFMRSPKSYNPICKESLSSKWYHPNCSIGPCCNAIQPCDSSKWTIERWRSYRVWVYSTNQINSQIVFISLSFHLDSPVYPVVFSSIFFYMQ